MALANILAAIQTVLLGISGISHAYTYEPVSIQPGQVPTIMQVAGKIQYWTITRDSTQEQRLANIETLRTHTIVLRGYQEVGDPAVTDPAFQALVESVQSTLRPTYELGVAGATAEQFGPVSVTTVGHRVLAQTWLVHYAECRIPVIERVTP